MRQVLIGGLALALVASATAGAQGMQIEHQPVACAVAGKFPRLAARFSPADAAAVARVFFQGNTGEWYSVAMKAEGLDFAGILPKPKKDLKTFRYYIEVTDKSLATARTAEFTTDVIASSGECRGKTMAAALGSASILLQGPAGVAGIPAGFASSGVVAGSAAGSTAVGSAGAAAGGGGLSTGAVVGIVGGVAGAAAVVAVKVLVKDAYSGPFSLITTQQFANCSTQSTYKAESFDIFLDINEGSVSGFGNINTGTSTITASNCPGAQIGRPDVWGLGDPKITGTQSSFSFQVSGADRLFRFSGALSGTTITGVFDMTWQFGAVGPGNPPLIGRATVVLQKQ